MVCFWSRGKHNRSRRDHVTAYRALHGAFATLVVMCSTRNRIKSEIKVTLQRVSFFYPIRSGMLLIFSYGILVQIISILLRVTLFLGVTYNKCITYEYTIRRIGTHDNVLRN